MCLWSSMTMQYIRTKQAEENWSLRQYNFLAGSRKTVPLANHSKDWTKIPTKSSLRLSPAVKATVRIFSSRTDFTSGSFLPYCLLSPKDCIFRHQLCPKWKRHALTLRLLMSYIYIYMEHLFLMFLDHTTTQHSR